MDAVDVMDDMDAVPASACPRGPRRPPSPLCFPAPLPAHSVQPFREAALVREGFALGRELPVEQTARDRNQRQGAIGANLGIGGWRGHRGPDGRHGRCAGRAPSTLSTLSMASTKSIMGLFRPSRHAIRRPTPPGDQVLPAGVLALPLRQPALA